MKVLIMNVPERGKGIMVELKGKSCRERIRTLVSRDRLQAMEFALEKGKVCEIINEHDIYKQDVSLILRQGGASWDMC